MATLTLFVPIPPQSVPFPPRGRWESQLERAERNLFIFWTWSQDLCLEVIGHFSKSVSISLPRPGAQVQALPTLAELARTLK